jgi:hypothetical protein
VGQLLDSLVVAGFGGNLNQDAHLATHVDVGGHQAVGLVAGETADGDPLTGISKLCYANYFFLYSTPLSLIPSSVSAKVIFWL